MDLLDPDLVITFMEYGSIALGFGILVIAPMELLVYGVVKAVKFFRL